MKIKYITSTAGTGYLVEELEESHFKYLCQVYDKEKAEFYVKAVNSFQLLSDALIEIRDVNGCVPSKYASALFAHINRTAREAIKAVES